MAASDYRLCDVCDGKAFYDARLNYDWDSSNEESPPLLYNDEPSNLRLDYLGAWAVLCEDCAKTHRAIIVPKEPKP